MAKEFYAVVKISYEYQSDITVSDNASDDEAKQLALDNAYRETGAHDDDDVEIIEFGWR